MANSEENVFLRAARLGDMNELERVLAANPKLCHGAVAVNALRSASSDVRALLLARNPDIVAEVDYDGDTALHIAALDGREEAVAQLLTVASPDQINSLNQQDYTALHYAVRDGHSLIVAQLLPRATAATLLALVDYEKTLLHLAAANGHDSIVLQLLAACPDLIEAVEACSRSNALHIAAFNGHDKVVAQLIAACPALMDGRDSSGQPPLFYAARGGHDTVVTQLLAARPSLIEHLDCFGMTALHHAGSERVATKLLDVSPEIIHKLAKRHYHTPLHEVLRRDDIDFDEQELIVARLLQAKPELIYAAHRGETPLHVAVLRAGESCILRLWSLHPDSLHAGDDYGYTPFHHAVSHQDGSKLTQLWQNKVSFDEAVSAFTACKKKNYQERLRPAVEAQCECLLTALGQDVMGVVYEYLGLDKGLRRKRVRP